MSQPTYQGGPGQGPQDAGAYQGMPVAPPVTAGYGYGAQPPVPQGMYYDAATELTLPVGVGLASVGRRIGAYFLSVVLAIVTLGIGYIIWGIVVWGKGTSPALQVLGMRAWRPAENRPATWGTMALRNIIGGIAGNLFGIMAVISFVLFLTNKQHKSIPDMVGGTVIVHDPNKVLG